MSFQTIFGKFENQQESQEDTLANSVKNVLAKLSASSR